MAMTKKEQYQMNCLKEELEQLKTHYQVLIEENIELRKITGFFDFNGWNESGRDEIIGNVWRIKWSDYILEFISENTFGSETENTLLYCLENCFDAGMEYQEYLNNKK